MACCTRLVLVVYIVLVGSPGALPRCRRVHAGAPRDIEHRNLDLVSPEFWPNLGSSGEPERLHLIRVLSSDDEIYEAVA